MKRLATIGFLFFACACQTTTKRAPEETSSNQGKAKFAFQQEFHNFGTLQAGETVAFSFRFTNTGTAGLIIEKAESDCGCITVKYPQGSIKPGEQNRVEVVFNSAGEVGRIYKEVILISNAEQRETKLAIGAKVENEWINIYN